jgi:hypothetical protein
MEWFPWTVFPRAERPGLFFFNIILDWGPVPHFPPLEALQPIWLMPEVYFTISRTISKRSYSGRHVPLASTTRGSPLAARGGTNGREMACK